MDLYLCGVAFALGMILSEKDHNPWCYILCVFSWLAVGYGIASYLQLLQKK